MSIDHKKLAIIHIVKRDLGLTDDAYRDLLQAATGVRSAKDLDEIGFRKLMRYFARSSHYRKNPFAMTYRQKLYIGHLRDDLGWDSSHFQNFLHKYYKKENLLTFTKKEASNLIESLKNIIKHQGNRS